MLSWVNPLRIFQAVLSLATIGLTAYEIASLYDEWSYSNVLYFMLFNGCWTTAIVIPYLGLAPLAFPRFSHEFAIPFMELTTGGLWLSGWIALAVLIPSPGSCHYTSCHALQALVVGNLRRDQHIRHSGSDQLATQREEPSRKPSS
ncbi:unnamed protein product [Penicillium salamii]|uniref:MARVEL domain-containing protein n=1 Tax=Penicillium salamii TaxID=1612424 RepID=A0A9W4JHU5_9EURO|nr:unnamed protein product [Penicillium salamii]CAG8175573.1 unnamed protein product [Penicillium salamii]CAG8206748.1 unnamed protein product [Penicillium salamii]CAG8235696.1 unnamed protein product [Penicillium salamii]CAG8306380.1 unnamed protein product [Penicillium salamii]